MFGFLNINKPDGMTSHDVVSALRRITKIKQIGHTGTLDPMAQGVLPIAIGKATRLIEYLSEDKGYIAELELGKISDTYDKEGNVEFFSGKKVTNDEFLEAINAFKGNIIQTPPAYSALHYNGKRLYELARQGIVPDDIPKRTVVISVLEVLSFDYEKQFAKINVECSKGTYIRSLINDIGQKLGTGAIMTELTRTKSGMFTIENSVSLDAISDIKEAEEYLINPLDVLSFNCYSLSEFEYQKIKHGQGIEVKDGLKSTEDKEQEYICLTFNNEICAIAQKITDSNKLKIQKVFIS